MDHRNFKFNFNGAVQFAITGFLVAVTCVLVLLGFLPTLLQDVPFREAAANVGAHAALGIVSVCALLKLLRRFTWVYQYDAAIVLVVLGTIATGLHWYGSYVANVANIAVFLAFFGLTARGIGLFVIALGSVELADGVESGGYQIDVKQETPSPAVTQRAVTASQHSGDDLARL